MTPELFDLLIIVNIIAGLALAGRRFYKDIRQPPPALSADAQPAAFSKGEK